MTGNVWKCLLNKIQSLKIRLHRSNLKRPVAVRGRRLFTAALLTLGAVSLSVVGTILGTVGCWAPALVSTHQVPAAPCPKAWQPRILPTVPATPWGIKSAPVENLCTAEWPFLTGWEFAQYREPRKMQALSSVWGTAASDYIWPQSPKPCLLCPVRSLLKRLNFDMCLHHARTNIEAVLRASQRHLWKWLTGLTPCLTPRDTGFFEFAHSSHCRRLQILLFEFHIANRNTSATCLSHVL